MPGWEQLGMQAASQGISGAMGLMLGNINDRRQLKQQEKLQNLQIKGDKQLTDYNFLKQMEMWRNTNYPAQMAMMKAAGLNPALMYEGGGQGGSTAITQGAVTGGNAPTGGGEIMQMMGMGLTRDLQLAQIENIKAQTAKVQAETGAVQPGIEKTKMETASLSQGITNQKAAAELMELDAQLKSVTNKIANESMNDQIATLKYQMQQGHQLVQKLKSETSLTETEAKWKERQIQAQLGLISIEGWLKTKQGSAIDQSVRESIDRMKTAFQNRLMQSDEGLINENTSEALNDNAFPEELKGILQALGIGLTLKKGIEPRQEIPGFHKR